MRDGSGKVVLGGGSSCWSCVCFVFKYSGFKTSLAHTRFQQRFGLVWFALC